MRTHTSNSAEMLRALLAAIPIVALSFAIPLVNRVEPRFFGMPFLLCWILVWAVITPVFLWLVGRLEHRW